MIDIPNIMINKVCNLNCSYCFANTFVNKDTCRDDNNITIYNFKKAVNFLCGSRGLSNLGIIGGEPLLHPKFEELMDIAICRKDVETLTVFTNGLNIDKFPNVFNNSKVRILVNVNSPEDIGEEKFSRIVNNLSQFKLKDRIGLGVNIYRDMDYSFITQLLRNLNLDKLRTSVVVPNSESKRDINPRSYFSSMKETMLNLFRQCRDNGVIAYYDCNSVPRCVFEEEELHFLEAYVKEFREKINYNSNLLLPPRCAPVIDVLPNLKAARCFGCSEENYNIEDFLCVEDLYHFFINRFDNYNNAVSMDNICRDCYSKKIELCYGGCISFKRRKLERIKKYVDELDKEEI